MVEVKACFRSLWKAFMLAWENFRLGGAGVRMGLVEIFNIIGV